MEVLFYYAAVLYSSIIFCHVIVPTVPVTGMPYRLCSAETAAAVFSSNIPVVSTDGIDGFVSDIV